MNKKVENLIKNGDFLKFKTILSKEINDHDKLLDIFNSFRKKLGLDNFEVINDNVNNRIKYGCLMLKFSIPNWDEILEHIDDEDIYDDDNNSFGKEYEPHVTILYGFHDDTEIDKIKEFIPKEKIEVTIDNISFFNNELFDVLKFDVTSDELKNLNEIYKNNFNYTNKFKDYHAHITISYLKKGLAEKYIKILKLKNNIILKTDKFVYSSPNKELTKLYERDIKFMDGVETVEIKDECKLGGLPNGKSKQCNQGDINVLNLKKI